MIQTPKLGGRIMRYELSDHEWTAIKPMLPNKPRGVPRGKRPPRPQWHLLGPTIWAPWRDLPDNFGPYANSITPTCGPFGGSCMSCRTILGDWGGHQEGALLRLRGALPARGGPVY